MKVTSKVYVGKVKEIDAKAIQCLVQTADALKSDVQQSQTIPKDIGELQDRSFLPPDTSEAHKGIVILKQDKPYARRLYFHPEYNFRKDKNPNAGGLWFDPYINGNKKDFVPKTFKKFMKGKM